MKTGRHYPSERANQHAPSRDSILTNSFSASNDAKQVVDAARNCGYAYIRKWLRQAGHREPSKQKIQRYFIAWVNSGGFAEFYSTVVLQGLRDIETSLGKPARELSRDERRHTLKYIQAIFCRYQHAFDGSKGRPRKPRGIIRDVLIKSGYERAIQKRKSQDRLMSRYIGFLDGALAKREKHRMLRQGKSEAEANDRLGSLSAWRNYLANADVHDKDHLPKGIFPRLFSHFAVPPDK